MKAKTKFPKIHTGYARNSVLFARNCRNGYDDTIYLLFLYIRLKIMKFKVDNLQKVWNVLALEVGKPEKRDFVEGNSIKETNYYYRRCKFKIQ